MAALLPTPDWKSLQPGKQNSDIYTEQSGYNDAVVTGWDYTTLTKWIYSGCIRRPFTGHI